MQFCLHFYFRFYIYIYFKRRQLKLFAVKYSFCLKQYFKTLFLRVGVCSHRFFFLAIAASFLVDL